MALFAVTTPIGALCGLLSTKAFSGRGVDVCFLFFFFQLEKKRFLLLIIVFFFQ